MIYVGENYDSILITDCILIASQILNFMANKHSAIYLNIMFNLMGHINKYKLTWLILSPIHNPRVLLNSCA